MVTVSFNIYIPQKTKIIIKKLRANYMKIQKKMICMIYVIILLFLTNVSFAFDFSVNDAIKVKGGESKYLEINITSDKNEELIFSIVGEKPWMTLSDSHLNIEANKIYKTKLYLSPTRETPEGTYKIILNVESLGGETKQKVIYVTVENKMSSVNIERLVVTGALEPSGIARLEINLRNYGKDTNVTIIANVSSPTKNIFELSEVVELESNEMKSLEKDFPIGECAEHGEYSVFLTLRNEEALDSVKQKFNVAKKAIMKKSVEEKGFVRYEKRIYLKNVGNIAGKDVVTEKVFGSMFYAGDKPTEIENDLYKWVINLKSCESKVIYFAVDYSPIVVIIFIIFAIWYVLFKFRTVRIKKIILQEKMIEEGEEFTVGIDVKTYINAKNVEIRDFVPNIFEVKDSPGIKPEKRKSEAGTELVWKFHELKRGEERIFDYKIVPMFGVHGRVKLTPAIIKFDYLTKKVVKKSAPVGIGIKEEKPVFSLDKIFKKGE